MHRAAFVLIGLVAIWPTFCTRLPIGILENCIQEALARAAAGIPETPREIPAQSSRTCRQRQPAQQRPPTRGEAIRAIYETYIVEALANAGVDVNSSSSSTTMAASQPTQSTPPPQWHQSIQSALPIQQQPTPSAFPLQQQPVPSALPIQWQQPVQFAPFNVWQAPALSLDQRLDAMAAVRSDLENKALLERLNIKYSMNAAVLEVIDTLKEVSRPPHDCQGFYRQRERYASLPDHQKPLEVAISKLESNYRQLLSILNQEYELIPFDPNANQGRLDLVLNHSDAWRAMWRKDRIEFKRHRRMLTSSWQRMEMVCDVEEAEKRMATIAEINKILADMGDVEDMYDDDNMDDV